MLGYTRINSEIVIEAAKKLIQEIEQEQLEIKEKNEKSILSLLFSKQDEKFHRYGSLYDAKLILLLATQNKETLLSEEAVSLLDKYMSRNDRNMARNDSNNEPIIYY